MPEVNWIKRTGWLLGNVIAIALGIVCYAETEEVWQALAITVVVSLLVDIRSSVERP